MDYEDEDLPISGKKVAAGVAAKFNDSQFDRNSLNSSERKLMDRVVMMMKAAESGELKVREHVQLVRKDEDQSDSDCDWDYEEEEGSGSTKKKELTKDMVSAALPSISDLSYCFIPFI